MKSSNSQTIVVAFLLSLALGLTASDVFAKQKSKTKISEKTAVKENSGRQADELPPGLHKYSEKNGELPSGLQKMKTEDGQLTKGLENGGKNPAHKVEGKTSRSKK